MDMEPIEHNVADGIATVIIRRGKVNALNGETIACLRDRFEAAERDETVRAVILTGAGKFFSFGFDIPEFLTFTPDAFTKYLQTFTDFYRYVFAFPKPVIAAINGHAVAGGCMVALACDYRVMSAGRATIGLNEISFGSSVFAGSVEMLRFWTGSAAASQILFGGSLYPATDALALGLVDEVVAADAVVPTARSRALTRVAAKQPAYGEIKQLLRAPVLEAIARCEAASIDRFVKIWYSPATWRELENITIR
jgi:Delta3-Delta2-enoyl-CoA isomerase